MKSLTIPYQRLEECPIKKLPLHALDVELWNKGNGLTCKADFTISHFDQGLRIHYSVLEPFLNARKRKINDDVHKDNCVEFFLAFDNEPTYYNFEFNCLGSLKAAYGKSRKHRKYLSPDVLKVVEDNIDIAIGNVSQGKLVKWDINIILPIEVFSFHDKSSFSGLNCSANFAKCGDNLPTPHFLSWINIPSQEPDFHQPNYFGKVTFEPNPILMFA
jgi:hypothetical protein